MKRTFNYTGLKRIPLKHVSITLTRSTPDPEFDATLNLAEYGFPGNAGIWVEAYRRTTWMRWAWGTVAHQQPPADRRLTKFDEPDGVLFRVRVVGQDEADRNRLLGEADRIQPLGEGEAAQQRRPLLITHPDDLGDELWRLDWEDDQPRLLINRNAKPSWRQAASTAWFSTLVYPEVLRQILKKILIEEKWSPNDDDGSDWRSDWLHFASRVLNAGPPPDANQVDDCSQWVDDAVNSFARRKGLMRLWNKAMDKDMEP